MELASVARFAVAFALVTACGGRDAAVQEQGDEPAAGPVAVPVADAPPVLPQPSPAALLDDPLPALPGPGLSAREFARLIEQLSEPGGFFPSDNLVSNETSYLHVLGKMQDIGVRGGAYVGVGPDQNFSYIAQIRPTIAFIIDIRRDNLLHHLLFKALFENARNRLEYLCLMLARPIPHDLADWDNASIDEIVLYVDTTVATLEQFEEANSAILTSVHRFGVPLSDADIGTIRGIHSIFFQYGLDIRYSNRGRGPFGRFPTWRLLMLETDLDGERRSYLASERAFRFIKDLERRNLVVPVVGDLAGSHALQAIGREVDRRNLVISAFYVSNVEQYLMQGLEFNRFAATVARLPFGPSSVMIRSYFARRFPIPQTVPGHISTQLLERFDTFVDEQRNGGYASYVDLVTRNAIPLDSNDREDDGDLSPAA